MLAATAMLLALAAAAPPQLTTPGGDWPAADLTLRLDARQLLALAERALASGDARTAEAAYDALSRDPNSEVRNEARYRQAKLLERHGRSAQAAVLLRRILDERPSAIPVRLELAQLLDRMGDKDAAWRELRAVQASRLPPWFARMVDRYSDALRTTRPAGASLELAIAPDSNISRSTRSDSLGTIFGDFDIGEDSKAKSGVGVSLRGQAFRRVPLGADDSLLVRASAFGDLYRKSRFNDVAFDLAAGPELRIGKSRLNLEAGATQRWFGQKPFQRSARLAASWTRPIGRRSQIRLSGSAALVDNQANDLQDGKIFSGQIGFEHALSATTGIALDASADRQLLKDRGYSTRGWRAGAVAWRDIGRTTLSAGAEFGRLRADERLALFPDKRSDRYSRFTLAASFRQPMFGGFAPSTRLVIERNRSTIAFYDYSRTRTELAIVRPF